MPAASACFALTASRAPALPRPCPVQSLTADLFAAVSRGKAFGALYLTGAVGGMLGALFATNMGEGAGAKDTDAGCKLCMQAGLCMRRPAAAAALAALQRCAAVLHSAQARTSRWAWRAGAWPSCRWRL